jgi:radical SAM protein with 4Fe4S-binding SPASM domain
MIQRDDCLRIITEAADMGVCDLTFSGGEPFLWSYLYEAVQKVIKCKMNASIYTTGNSPDFKKHILEFKKLGIKSLVFSIFGANSRTHEQITRKSGSFCKTLDAIKYVISKQIKTQLHFVPTSKNYKEINAIVKLAKELKVTMISILRLVPQGRASLLPNDVLSKLQNIEFQQQIYELREIMQCDTFNIRTGSPYNFLLLNEDVKCLAALNQIIIDPDLHIFPCDAFKGILAKEIVNTDQYSNLSKCSLKQCWEKSPYLHAIRNTVCAEYSERCQKCNVVSKCKSGCLAQKVIFDKQLFSRHDPDCIMI